MQLKRKNGRLAIKVTEANGLSRQHELRSAEARHFRKSISFSLNKLFMISMGD